MREIVETEGETMERGVAHIPPGKGSKQRRRMKKAEEVRSGQREARAEHSASRIGR